MGSSTAFLTLSWPLASASIFSLPAVTKCHRFRSPTQNPFISSRVCEKYGQAQLVFYSGSNRPNVQCLGKIYIRLIRVVQNPVPCVRGVSFPCFGQPGTLLLEATHASHVDSSVFQGNSGVPRLSQTLIFLTSPLSRLDQILSSGRCS